MRLEVKGLSYSYKKKDRENNPYIHDVSFNLEKGQCAVLLGPNGAGKTTIVKLIDKLLAHYSGSILIDGREVSEMKAGEIAHLIGYVPQVSNFENMTVFDSVLMGRIPYLSHSSREKDLEIVENAIKYMGLEAISAKNINETSSGERQKAIIARALAQEPELLIFDEPLNNLDIKAQADTVDVMKKVKERGISVLAIMHDISLSLEVADRFLLMKEGGLIHDIEKNELTAPLVEETFGVHCEMNEGCVIIRKKEN